MGGLEVGKDVEIAMRKSRQDTRLGGSKSFRCALDLLSYIAAKDANIGVIKLQVLLIVSMRRDCTIRDIVKLTGRPQPTICRCVGDMSDRPTRTSVPALNWLKVYPDPEDPRRVLVNLGALGRAELKKMHAFFR